jgi:myo-inositol-1(or 4)-monophosphatase
MDPASDAFAEPWLAAWRGAARELQAALEAAPTTVERAREVGRGEGGDMTVAIDEQAEEIVFGALGRLYDDGYRFTALSEERGEVDFGDPEVRVVIDPIDGSLNAKRGLPPHCLSIAVADGPTVGDVALAFVHDFGTGEEWTARRGGGACLDGRPLDPDLPERRDRQGRLEMLAVESADPRWVAPAIDDLVGTAHRLRALGTIALSLCSVAAARVDGMISLRNCRSFDAAAAALVVREAGGHVAFPRCDDPLGAPLDLEPRSPVAAARTAETLDVLAGIPD